MTGFVIFFLEVTNLFVFLDKSKSKNKIMQKQTIRKIIDAKMESWLESITDSVLRNDVRQSLLVSGGSIASMFMNEPVNDYDVYIQDRTVLIRLVTYYTRNFGHIKVLDGNRRNAYIDESRCCYTREEFLEHNSHDAIVLRTLKPGQVKIKVNGGGGYKVDYEMAKEADLKPYRPLFFSPNAISLSDDIQIVNRFFGSPQEIHKTFDFVHATNYYTSASGLVTNLPAVESIMTKQLFYQGSEYPLTSIIRSKKFVGRGFRISAGELLKMMFQISLLDLTNMDTLEEQLIGVDVAYFSLLIEALRDHQQADKEFKLTPEYLNVLIEKIFRDAD